MPVYANGKAVGRVETIDLFQSLVDARGCYYLFRNTNVGLAGITTLDTSKVTSMEYMFYGASNLDAFDFASLDASKVTNMRGMFYGCSSLTALDLSGFDTSKVTNMWGMFSNCSSLATLDLSGFDTSNVTNMWYMFENCSSLTALKAGKPGTCKQSFSLSNSYNLSSESVIGVANWLYDYSSGSSHTLTLHNDVKTNIADQYVKPSSEEGVYVACESGDEGAILLTNYINNKNWSIA